MADQPGGPVDGGAVGGGAPAVDEPAGGGALDPLQRGALRGEQRLRPCRGMAGGALPRRGGRQGECEHGKENDRRELHDTRIDSVPDGWLAQGP